MADSFNAGFVRDEQGRLVLSGGSESEGWISGFVRDAEGRLVVTGPEGSEINGAITPQRYGAKGDGTQLTDGSMTKGSKVLASAYAFKAKDIGKPIVIFEAGPGSGLSLVTTIASVSGGVATLAKAAESAISSKEVLFGTDDTKAIQAAIDAAGGKYAATGSIQSVRLPTGSYIVSNEGSIYGSNHSALIIKSGVDFSGFGATIYQLPPPRTVLTEAFTAPLAGATIKVADTTGLGLDAAQGKKARLRAAGFESSLTWTGSTATTLTGVTASGAKEAPVGSVISCSRVTRCISSPLGEMTHDFKIRGLVIDGLVTTKESPGGNPEISQEGIHISNAHDFEISDNEVRHFAGKLINCEQSSGEQYSYVVARNDLHHNFSQGMRYTAPCHDFQIVDNYIHDTSREHNGGAESIGSTASLEAEHGIIARNTIRNMGSATFGGRHLIIEGNVVVAPAELHESGAIRIGLVEHCQVNNNSVDVSFAEENSGTGIQQEDVWKGVSITGNVITSCKGNPGLRLNGTGGEITISGNYFGGEGSTLIKGTGLQSDITVSGNVFAHTGAVTVEKLTRGSFVGNVVKGTSAVMTALNDVLISGNSFFSAEGKGQTLRIAGSKCVVSGNKLTGANATSGVLQMDATCFDCIVSGNVIEAASENANWIGEASGANRNLISGNHFIAASTGSSLSITGADTMVRANHGTDGSSVTFPRKSTATGYTMKVWDELVGVTSTAAERTITLPAAAAVPIGVRYVVKDESGAAGTNKINVVPKTPASEKIDGAEASAISSNYGKVVFYSNHSNWFTV